MILRSLPFVLTATLAAASALAAPRELTLFSDGSLVEIESTARRGIAETVLPAQLRDGTLRVKPLDGGTIERVDVVPFHLPDKLQKELDSLGEQKNRLEDRLKALDTREGIFEAAAKSQSSKAPRKSKTNPDPLASVRQGTDFAIAQLEAVYTSRRRTEQELKRVTSRIAYLTRRTVGGPTIRVTLTPSSARVRIAAVLADHSWKARYELRLTGSTTARLVQLAEAAELPDGFTIRIAPVSLTAAAPLQTVPLLSGKATPVAAWQLPVTHEQVVVGPLTDFTITLQNTTGKQLPGGVATIYNHGEYLGTVPLPATAANTNLTVTNHHLP